MGTHPIFESDFDCLTDIFQMSRQSIPLQDLIIMSGLDRKEFAALVGQISLVVNQAQRFPSFFQKLLGATEVLRDTFEEYAEGDKTKLTIRKFAELCRTVFPHVSRDVFEYRIYQFFKAEDKDKNELLDFQEFITLMVEISADPRHLASPSG